MYGRENLFRISSARLRRTSNISEVLYPKFPPLENAIFSGFPLSFCPAVSIARSEIYFSPGACAELSKIPACLLARASTLRRNAKSVVGAPSFFGPRPRENIRCKFNAESGGTGGVATKNAYDSQINRPIFGQEKRSLTHGSLFDDNNYIEQEGKREEGETRRIYISIISIRRNQLRSNLFWRRVSAVSSTGA